MQPVTERETERVSVAQLEIRAGKHRTVVAPFSWQHAAGRLVWLTGENGAGKSSLLRVLAGCEAPFLGRVEWQTAALRLRYYAPVMSVPDDLPISAWIDVVRALHGSLEDSASVSRLLPAISRQRRFSQLSTGEAKRFLLWSLLRPMAGPLILDEPYEHLSREARNALTETLRLIAATSVVLVATNQEVPAGVGDTILTLDGNQLRGFA